MGSLGSHMGSAWKSDVLLWGVLQGQIAEVTCSYSMWSRTKGCLRILSQSLSCRVHLQHAQLGPSQFREVRLMLVTRAVETLPSTSDLITTLPVFLQESFGCFPLVAPMPMGNTRGGLQGKRLVDSDAWRWPGESPAALLTRSALSFRALDGFGILPLL
jgi:hypothetical protein